MGSGIYIAKTYLVDNKILYFKYGGEHYEKKP
jgi:hypothetical protein